jgi:tetratricopeptide repeat protein
VAEETLGPEHIKVARNVSNLANLCHAQGWYAEAEPLYTRALGIPEKALQDGRSRRQTNRRAEAEALEVRAKCDRRQARAREQVELNEERRAGPDPVLAYGLDQAGLACQLQGKDADAEGLYLRSLAQQQSRGWRRLD